MNPKWRGSRASVGTLHQRLGRNFPKAGKCEQCGAEGPTDYALLNGREYSSDRADYRELCRLCHNRYDAPKGRPGRDPATGRWVKGANSVA